MAVKAKGERRGRTAGASLGRKWWDRAREWKQSTSWLPREHMTYGLKVGTGRRTDTVLRRGNWTRQAE